MMTPNVIPRVMLIAFGAFLVAVPWLIPMLLNKFWVSVIAEIMIWSLFAASVNLLFGYVGLLSFGQALYFGFGMYGVAIGVATLGLSFWPAFGLGIAASVAIALVSGIFAVRLTWHYFAIMTYRAHPGAELGAMQESKKTHKGDDRNQSGEQPIDFIVDAKQRKGALDRRQDAARCRSKGDAYDFLHDQ